MLVIAMGVLMAPGTTSATSTAGFPSGFEDYHDYAETSAALAAAAEAHPGILRLFSIGRSHEGREIWAVKISDNVATDETEPEVLMDSLHHAREHLTVEMALRVIHLLADNYRANPVNIETDLQRRVTKIVRSREIWIVPMVNPDGGEYDLSGPDGQFMNWRRNTQPIVETAAPGIDLNRNWGFKWGCCGGSSSVPGSSTYRGQYAWQAPEVAALRDFVLGRVVNGRQQIRAAISWHAFNEEIMWPYGYTTADLPRTMSPDDLVAFRALGEGMAALNGYVAQQLSDLYVLDGGASDWLYGDQRIFAFLVEMYPTDGSDAGGFYPPDDVIERETMRNDEMVLHFLENADCPYRAAGLATTHCGPLNDDFEATRGWRLNPGGSDTATIGTWERATAEESRSSTGIKQRAYGYSGAASLVTGALRGGSVSANDVDSGVTSIESPSIALGAAASGWTLAFRYAFAHNSAATAVDYLRVSVNGTPVFARVGNRSPRNAVWTPVTVSIDAFAGQSVRILVSAADLGNDSLVEAAIDDLRVYRVP